MSRFSPPRRLRAAITLVLVLLVLLVSPAPPIATQAQEASRTFAETGKTVKGRLLEYWNTHGVLPQQGYPISEEMRERSDIDGKVYTVQYLERAVFELHPEYKPPYDLLLSLLGVFQYKQKHPNRAPNQTPEMDSDRFYSAATALRDGRALITGGYGYDIVATSAAWIYEP